jgi:hypothetical protein
VKTCSKCHRNKVKSEFYAKQSWCKDCVKAYNKSKYPERKDKVNQFCREYYQSHKDEILESHKTYRENNKEAVRKRDNAALAKRRKNNPILRLKKTVSRSINNLIKINGSSKNRQTISLYLQYSIEELKQHLQSQFELWMTWNNWGQYNHKTWDDNDQTTWTWQLDHIVPHSTFKYTSMDSQEFRDCWALSNLRPLSAKQNFLDGFRKMRNVVS